MHTINDVWQQFAEYFETPALKPYAYLLFKKLDEGHICLQLDDELPADLPPYCANMQPGTGALQAVPLVGTNGNDSQPFVLFQNRLYLQRYFRYETEFLKRILHFITTEKAVQPERLALLNNQRTFISSLFTPQTTTSYPDWQLAAAITGVLNDFTIITGGPGTGKTTTVAKLLAILYATAPTLKVALAAPTGKAAARMAESLRKTSIPAAPNLADKFQSLSPGTIHRLLKPKKNSPYFQHNAANPLPFDVIIVDECSMIDVALFTKLFDAIGAGTRLILLGDKDQLASVEAGSFFGDLCQAQSTLNEFSADRIHLFNSFINTPQQHIPDTYVSTHNRHPLFQHLVELRHSHRFSDIEGIGKFSKAIISNKQSDLLAFITAADPHITIDTTYAKKHFDQFIAGYEAFITEPDIRTALRKLNDLRVLCAIREGEHGLYAINKAIEHYLQQKKLIRTNTEFYTHRPIILTRNYYEHGLFNGDTGLIRPDTSGTLLAWFEDSSGTLKAVLPGYLTEAETAFAMTIHKSQGSEFQKVLVILPTATDAPILTRELLYTAVTRAREKVTVQASQEVLVQAASRFVERASGIAARFAQMQLSTCQPEETPPI